MQSVAFYWTDMREESAHLTSDKTAKKLSPKKPNFVERRRSQHLLLKL